MATFDVAHINEQGQNIIIVLVSHQLTPMQERTLQLCANTAGLAGVVVPVWPHGMGMFGFSAPIQWHSYFRSLFWEDILMNVNTRLTCG